MARTTITFECDINILEFEALEYQIYNEVKRIRKEICEKENAALKARVLELENN